MEIIKIIAVAVLSCVLVKIIAPYRADLALLVQLAAVIVMLISVSSSLIGLMAQTRKLTAIMSFDSGYLSLLLRALIVALSCGVACEICSDSGNGAIRFCVELAGRATLLMMAFPLLTELVRLALNLAGAAA